MHALVTIAVCAALLMIDHYWQRGPAFAAWAAAGMAVAVYARFRAPASDAGEDG